MSRLQIQPRGHWQEPNCVGDEVIIRDEYTGKRAEDGTLKGPHNERMGEEGREKLWRKEP